ncbi:MAG: TM0106 family RecB-like putative nuclease [Desulfomonilaceae bacterium]
MRIIDNNILFSATDLCNFLECEHLTALDKINLTTPLPRTPDTDEAQLFQNKGFEHEQSYLQKLADGGINLMYLSEVGGTLHDKAAATLEAMKTGADIIFQGTLFKNNLYGHPDFLRKAHMPSNLGSFSYEVMDTKLAGNPKTYFIVQLCFYSDLLTDLQGFRPRMTHVILGDKTELNFRVDQFNQYYQTLKERFLDCMSQDVGTYPEANEHCDMCRWRGLCEDQWQKDDHLNQVANITKIQIKKLRSAGIHTLAQLAEHDDHVKIQKLAADTLIKLRHQAYLQTRKRATGANELELLPLDPDGIRGFYRLPKPDPGDLFFDMEGDPLELNGLEYLFGVYYRDGDEPKFQKFWAHNRDEERKAFEAFMDFVAQRLKKYPSAHIYHYASYEESALKRLMCLHGIREAQVDDLLRRRKLVDLYKVVRESVRVSEPRYSIKNLETFYAEKRSGDVKNAMSSIVFYNRWLQTGDKKILDEIAEYNHEDCRSTYLLREWLLTFRPSDLPWMNQTQPGDDKKTRSKSDRQIKLEATLESYRTYLLKDHTINPEDRVFRELVFYLLDFHRRCEKPAWWSIFSRMEMADEDLIDDPECIGGMTLARGRKKLDPNGGGVVYQYPEQEFKLGEGDKCVCAGAFKEEFRIVRIDENERLVQVESDSGEAPPERLSVSTGGPIRTGSLTKAVFRFADSIISGDKRYEALESILNRSIPSITHHSPGQPIVDPQEPDLKEIIEAVAGLRKSYLFIQGPPGTGKTYTGSHIIAELLRRGYRVGVSSNSHKAINNLLKHVELRAEEIGLQFEGLKKSSDNKSSWFQGKFIGDVTSNKEIYESKAHLVAGTAWLFAGMDQNLDFLFVDEAGQVSLANLVAMGLSAKNIVLLGDQMQLGQPIQGTHPGRSGESTLEYLLDGEATIKPDRGVFLDVTWRMRQDVCQFISEAVYDSRLKPEEHNQNQRLLLNSQAHECLKPSGVSFVPIDHDGCSQKSQEEGDLIKEMVASLVRQSYRDRNGNEQPITLENIMVVAPYNMQVNLLKRVLPKGARVGTVDKFQGQESEVVIVSMTTSSGEYLPRRIEFLYSKNRLNVAISRARTLSILVVNPLLLSIRCNTIEQIQLVNTLCWARNYSNSASEVCCVKK